MARLKTDMQHSRSSVPWMDCITKSNNGDASCLRSTNQARRQAMLYLVIQKFSSIINQLAQNLC